MRRVALLDRDGTIIVDKFYLREPDCIEFTPGAVEGLRLLRDAGFDLVLITNQSGIARGYFDEAALAAVHARLEEMLATEGVRFAGIYHCPHKPDDHCDCRKPQPGMVFAAERDLGFTADNAVFIGDSSADMQAAAAAGIVGIRIRSNCTTGEGTVPDFLAAARAALNMVVSK